MKHLTNLFKLVEITRSQSQYGYALSGIQKHELSDLACHHYLVTFIAWQLARNLNRAGAKLNVEKVLEFALTHDLGELFGGDISMPYGAINPRAKKLAKAFEAENHRFLAQFFGNDSGFLKKLVDEIMDAKSDEALIAKIADYLECVHYKIYVDYPPRGNDLAVNTEKVKKMIGKLKDPIAKKELGIFITTWLKEVGTGTALDAMWSKAKKKF